MLFPFDIDFINAAFLSCHIVINEFAPVFAISQNRSFLIPSLLAEGWLVTTLTATDMDIIDSNVTYYLEETGDYTLFRIGEVNGELRLNASLSAGNYTVCVLARDGGGMNSEPFYITIEVFTIPQPDLTFEGGTVIIKETLAVNSSIFNVTCSLEMNSTDPELLLSADTARQPFHVQRLFGIGIYTVVLMDDIDQSSTPNYSLTITCINSAYKDTFNVTTSETITVNITVEDVPEVWIAFSSSSYSTNITENSRVGTIINLPVAVRKYTRLQDNASFENGTLLNSSSVNLTVVGLEPYLVFDVAKWSAVVVRNIDRESFTSPFLFINVSAEMANTTGDSAVIHISILDVNDNRPLISELVFVGNASTRTRAMEAILTVQASDADDGDNALIHFSLDNTTYFAINQSSGVIHASSSPLPTGEFVLTVTATDSGTPPLSSESKIAISVFEDLVAKFDNDTYIFSILEELPPGSLVGNVAIATTAHVIQEPMYSIVPGKGSEVFYIDLFSGELVTLTKLDREANSYFNICISMVVGSSNAAANVLITVLDVNDNAPEFEESYYHFTLQCREQEDVTGVEYQVSASDRDMGRNADVVYNLQPLDNVTINNTTGRITPLACLAEGEHEFTVTATDGGEGALSGDAIVVISAVPALPDNLILQQSQPDNFSLAENNVFGAHVGSIKVANLPESLLSHVEYSLQGNDNNFFHFDGGELRAAVRFDRESHDLFTFQVVAMLSDRNLTSSGSATVVVHILDENDNDPHFHETIYSPLLKGPVESMTEVLTVAATDADLGRNSEIFYSIEGQASHSFVVNNETGIISAKNRLLVGVYRLVAVAMDGGSTPRTDRVPVIVHVDHADPDALECVQTPFNFSVADGTSANHFVGVLQVNVSNGVPLPRLDYQTDFTYFVVDVNGFLFTNASIDLDTQLTGLYTFNVTISANTSTGVISVPCLVSVWVTSVNDNLPVLTNLPNSTVVKEERDIGTSVFNVTAIDKDSDAQLIFKLLTFQNQFQINPLSGEITVKTKMNREDGNTHFELAVVVSDGKGTSNPGILNVAIEDINDNAPVLVTPLVHTIDERCCVNEAVFIITVNDPDSGSNGEVVIEIVSPKELFRIENTTVYLLQELDFQVVSLYNITINLTDNGNPGLSVVDVIEIVVVDKPDNPPVFGLEPGGVDQYYVPIAPNISAGAIVFHLMAFDPDLNRVSYSIIQVHGSTEGNFTKDDFEIGEDSGIIRKLRKGNFTADQNVTIVVEATDDSIYNVKTNISVLLYTVPQSLTFVQGTYQFNITENAVLSDIQCKDMYLLEIVEVSRAREIVFRIVNSTVSTETFQLVRVKDEFDLDKGAGLCLTTDSVLDHEIVQMIELLVQGSSATGIAFVTVEITVEDINDNPPIVNSDSTALSVDERNVVGHSIAEFTVTDADSGVNGMYHLYIDPPDTPVEIVKLGTHYSLNLTESLNYEAQSNYTFDVVAVDTGEPAMNGSLTFHLSVVDVHDPPSMPPPTLLPSVTSWRLDLNVGVLTLEVNNSEGLNVSTANCSAFQIVREAFDTNRSGIECSSAPLLSASSVALTLSFNEQYLLSTDPGIATNVSNTFLVIEQHHQIFNGAGCLLTIPPDSPLQAMMVIPDTTGPRLVSFTFDLDYGLLTLQFSEPVTDFNAMPSAITLQSASNGTGTSYTLTGGGLQSQASTATLEIIINDEDLNAVKALLDLATSAANTFLSFISNITKDYAFNEAEPIASSNAVPVFSLIPDTTPPMLINFSLDMNTGQLMLVYDETIDASSFDPALITLQNSAISPSTLFNLTSGVVSSLNGPLLLVHLSALDSISLASERQLAVSRGTTYIQVAGGAVTDTSGNPSGPVTGLQTANFTADTTRPLLLMFTLDRSHSELNLTFSEPVDVDTFNITSLTLQSGPGNMSTMYTVTGGTVRELGSVTSLQLTLSGNDTAALQTLPELATDLNNTYISFPAALVADNNGNQVSPVSPEHPLQVSGTVYSICFASLCDIMHCTLAAVSFFYDSLSSSCITFS